MDKTIMAPTPQQLPNWDAYTDMCSVYIYLSVLSSDGGCILIINAVWMKPWDGIIMEILPRKQQKKLLMDKTKMIGSC